MTTLVFVRHAQIGNRQFAHGEELPPGLLPPEIIGHWIDQRWLAEYDSAERRSLYRLLPRFSGAKDREPFAQNEVALFALR